MPSIIKKGTNPSQFSLSNGENIILRPDIITVLSENSFNLLMQEYGSFIKERTLSDKNIFGCFIIHNSKNFANSQNKEAGELKDNSAPVKLS